MSLHVVMTTTGREASRESVPEHLYRKTMSFALLLFATTVHGLDIALHAQSKSTSHGWVAGSEITTRGLRNALVLKGHTVEIFAPFAYEKLGRPWDLLLIEGYSGPAERVIRAVRRENPNVLVFHWCLDTYPHIEAVKQLPVDVVVTNSHKLAASTKHVPHYYLPLGVDATQPRRQQPWTRQVVYLGQPSPTKVMLVPTLLEIHAAGFALDIFGTAWDRFGRDDDAIARLVECCWRGALDSDQIQDLYGQSHVVLGTTETAQQKLGMVNNRVYEALASGTRHYLAIEEPGIHFVKILKRVDSDVNVVHSPPDAVAFLKEVLSPFTTEDDDEYMRIGKRQDRVLGRHSYDRRASTLLSIYEDLAVTKFPRLKRGASEVMALAYDAKSQTHDRPWLLGLVPALMQLELDDGTRRPMDFDLVDIATATDVWCADATMVAARGTIHSTAVNHVANVNCTRYGGSDGKERRVTTMLFLQRDPRTGTFFPPDYPCADLLRFDGIVYDRILVDDATTPECLKQHPRATAAMGVDVAQLRERSQGWVKLDLGNETNLTSGDVSVETKIEARGTLLRRTGEVVAATDFDVLAGLVAGARVTVPPGELAVLLNAVTSGDLPVEAFNISALATKLHTAIEDAFDTPRAMAAVKILRPRPDDILDCDLSPPSDDDSPPVAPRSLSCRVEALVNLTAFVTPDDGVWCLRIQNAELSCQGDTKNDLLVTFNVDLPEDNAKQWPVTVQAVLRAGLGTGPSLASLPVVRESPPVNFWIKIR